jgi:hypothetical protein
MSAHPQLYGIIQTVYFLKRTSGCRLPSGNALITSTTGLTAKITPLSEGDMGYNFSNEAN